ncbi:hypothetical protein Pmar_PMAR011638, partial [Perkinsus marinus ATCC 50983]
MPTEPDAEPDRPMTMVDPPTVGFSFVTRSGGIEQGGRRFQFDDTTDLANMGPKDILEPESNALKDPEFCETHEVCGIRLGDLVLALQGRPAKKPQNESAYTLARGGAHGPYFRLSE